MRFDILTLFPHMFSSPFQESILARAIEKGLIQIRTINIRDFALDKHHVVDDTPYGGGQGMVMKVEPIARAIEWAKSQDPSAWTIYLTPQGKQFNQDMAQELSSRSHLILLCGRYEGIDERVRELLVDEEISIGDYVLTGGELAAMVLIDAVSRLLPGVLGSDRSAEEDSFFHSLLEYPQYTRPFSFRGRDAPQILLSGNHGAISLWRRREALRRTSMRRPDLLARANLSDEDKKILEELFQGESINDFGLRIKMESNLYLGLVHHPIYDKRREVISTAVTNLDIHDIARCARTFGVRGLFVITPLESQVQLVERMICHWMEGAGSVYNPTRKESLSLVRVSRSIDEASREISDLWKKKVMRVATGASPHPKSISFEVFRKLLEDRETPFLILFGTGWGLTQEVKDNSDYVLAPIGGRGYNHLSVRSAVPIILDRLLGDRVV